MILFLFVSLLRGIFPKHSIMHELIGSKHLLRGKRWRDLPRCTQFHYQHTTRTTNHCFDRLHREFWNNLSAVARCEALVAAPPNKPPLSDSFNWFSYRDRPACKHLTCMTSLSLFSSKGIRHHSFESNIAVVCAQPSKTPLSLMAVARHRSHDQPAEEPGMPNYLIASIS